ncbi:hypothetical protein H0E87_005650, partial [Populus deltoides]
MKKAFDQTVRDIKREVNKKVLKVPSIEQKVKSSLALFENVKALSGVEPIHFD